MSWGFGLMYRKLAIQRRGKRFVCYGETELGGFFLPQSLENLTFWSLGSGYCLHDDCDYNMLFIWIFLSLPYLAPSKELSPTQGLSR